MIGNKIIVIGCPGSGKSYFTRELHQLTSLPIYYIDCLFWKENWTHISRDELINEFNKIFKEDKWIIDGNYIGTLELRMKEAETIFFLDIEEKICIESERLRRGNKRDDLPSYLEEKEDPEFIEYIKAFRDEQRPQIISLLEKYNDKQIIIFTSRNQKDQWIQDYKTNSK